MANYTYAQLVDIAKQGGFPAAVAPVMAAIALAESSGNPLADNSGLNRNGSTDYGLWQINSVHSDLLRGGNWRDPVQNARMAYSVYKSQGLKAWSSYNSGSYKKFASGDVSAGTGIGTINGGVSGTANAADPFSGVTGALGNIGQSLQGISALASTAQKLALPQTWVRIMAGVFGAGLVGFGVVMLTKEVRN